MSSAYYRFEDPLENFKVRVVARAKNRSTLTESTEGAVDDSTDGADMLHSGSAANNFYHESILSWQEKLYSPSDIADYLRNKDSR